MNYIVNPMWFYWMQIVERLQTVAIFLIVLSLIIAGCATFSVIDADTDAEEATGKRIIKGSIIVVILATLFFVFAPSKETIIEMMIVRYATAENVSLTVEALKSAVDYIVEAIKSI